MSQRVSPTERIRAEIDALFASEHDLASTLEDVARLTVRLMMQTAIDAEDMATTLRVIGMLHELPAGHPDIETVKRALDPDGIMNAGAML